MNAPVRYTSAEDRAHAQGVSRHDHRKATRKMRWWYEALADHMIANPTATQNELAAHFGRVPATISTIINTDAFKAYYRQRRGEVEGNLAQDVRSKLHAVAGNGLDLILKQFEKKQDSLPIDTIQRAVDSSLKALGMGVSGPGVVVNQNVDNRTQTVVPVSVSMADLEAARAALRASQSDPNAGFAGGGTASNLVIDVTPNEE